MNSKSDDRPQRVKGRRSFILLAFFTLLLATGVALVHAYIDDIGERMPAFDPGIANALTTMAVMLTGFLWWVWLIIKGPTRFWSRVVPLLLVLLVVAGFILVEPVFDGNVGLVGFRWRFGQRAPEMKMTNVKADLKADQESGFYQFLGPDRNGRIKGVQLDHDWDGNPPEELWKHRIGTGASGFVANEKFAITMEQRDQSEMVNCYELKTGLIAWSYKIENRHHTTLGKEGPRSTPVIHRGKVYSVGANGHLACIDGNTGEAIWKQEISEFVDTKVEENSQLIGLPYHTEKNNLAWGRSGSPLIHDNLVIVPGGGPMLEEMDKSLDNGKNTSLIGFDLETGEMKWKAGTRSISYSSPNFATLAGIPQIVIINEASANGYDVETGKELWHHKRTGSSSGQANCSQVTIVSANQVLVSQGYGFGSELLELSKNDDGTLDVEVVWQDSRMMKTKFTNPIIKDGYAYGLSEGILECIDVTTGERQWKQGRFGNGQILMVGDDLLVTGERSGDLYLIAASPEKYIEHGNMKKVVRGICWNTLCYIDGKLLMRSDYEVACLQLPLKSNDQTGDDK